MEGSFLGGESSAQGEPHGLIQMLRTQPYAVQKNALRPQSSIQQNGAEGASAENVHQAAAHGIQGGGEAMPHLSAIQQSFGTHDVSGIQAHSGSAATQANEAMGAEAYATGNHVAFKTTPDLHTAAHEAAHVVQQRSGVSLSGGVGAVGDSYEQHADKVADAVVGGQSAEGLLNEMGGGAGVQQKSAGGAGSVVQKDEKAGEGEKGNQKPARVHLMADVDVTSLGIKDVQEGNVGHTWVALEWKDPSAVPASIPGNHRSLLMAGGGKQADPFGFWPAINEGIYYSTNLFNSYVKGWLRHPDEAHKDSVKASQSWDITEDQAKSVITYAESQRSAQYSVYFYNCTTFGVGAIKAAGLSAPSGGSLVCYPNQLYDSIKSRHQAGTGDTHAEEMDGSLVPRGANASSKKK